MSDQGWDPVPNSFEERTHDTNNAFNTAELHEALEANGQNLEVKKPEVPPGWVTATP